MIDLSERRNHFDLAGTRARLIMLCRECQKIGQTLDERERARKILSDLKEHQISEEDFAFITHWAILDRALARAKIPLLQPPAVGSFSF